jgi:cytochrome c5
MSEIHTEKLPSPIKTPRQLVGIMMHDVAIAVGLVAVLASLVACDSDYSKNHPGMSDEAIAKRLQPVGTVVVAEPGAASAAATPAPAAAPPAPAPAAAPAPAGAAKADLDKGKAVYDKACAVCHAAGVAGAPKTSDKAAWATRLKTGMDPLYVTALKGKGAMPPKGGNVALPDADVKAAVDYMVSLVK